ncbi:aquaporin-like protein [Massarina eburnea CBS 473.64]|uniref:Aquaporin-like protein n=1 Tax=Massarina eburnea CBS 473.64 TaxID=1395130 RepID=A0A6A6SBG3_9PLEO|nr:aquaporin-like protein [Massarina eburnea CBS 473.64]
MKPAYTTDPNRPGEKRLPELRWLPNRVRHMLISMLGEFVGTYLFLFFAFAGTQVANTPPSTIDDPASTSTLLYIALAFGFSLAVNVWIFFRISGGLFNPAVSIALALIGAIGWLKAGLLIIAQILGGIAAAAVTSALLPGDLKVRTSLSESTSITRGLFIETLLTAELIFCIFMLAAEKHKATYLAPIGIGLALFIAELAGVFYTGGSLNPARSFGPDVVLRTFDGYHWIYWVGPILGAIIAVVFYRLIKLLEYETANPGADSDGREERYAEPLTDEDIRRDRNAQPLSSFNTALTHNTAGRRTDGTDESEFLPPFQPTNKPNHFRRSSSRFEMMNGPNGTDGVTVLGDTYSLPSMPSQPLPAFQHGGDGHRSFDDRNSGSMRSHSRSRASQYEEASDHSFRSAPHTESGSSVYSSRGSS